MKKLYFSLIMSILALGLFSCQEDELVGSGNIEPTVRITASDVVFDAQSGSGTIQFEAEGSVSVTSSKDWCSVSLSGNTVAVSVTANENIIGRSSEVILACGSYKARVIVQQKGFVFKYSDGESELIDWTGGSITIPGTSTFAPKLETAETWISTEMNEDGTITANVAENDSADPRVGNLNITLGDIVSTYVINQGGWPFECKDTIISVGYSAGSSVLLEESYKEPTFSSDVTWLSASWENGKITVSYTANEEINERVGKLTITAGKQKAVVEIKQAKEFNFAGTYSMSFFTSSDESATSTPEVVMTRDASDKKLYHLTGILDGHDWDIPLVYNADKDRLELANVSSLGSEDGKYIANTINYIKGTSSYLSYATDAKYSVCFSYTVDANDKISLEMIDTGSSIGTDRNVVGFTIYSFKSKTFNKDNRVSALLTVRKPKMQQK